MSGVLHTLPHSHFSEKARWALDWAGIEYRERKHLQILHRFASKRAGGTGTVPVLQLDGAVHAESMDIVVLADARCPAERKLLPPEGPQRDAHLGWLATTEEKLSAAVRVWGFENLLPYKQTCLKMLAPHYSLLQRVQLRLVWGLALKWIRRQYDVDARNADLAEKSVWEVFDALEERARGAGPYLAGERFGAADLALAAVAAPVLLPEQFGGAIARLEDCPVPMQRTVRALRGHWAGQHLLRVYAEHR